MFCAFFLKNARCLQCCKCCNTAFCNAWFAHICLRQIAMHQKNEKWKLCIIVCTFFAQNSLHMFWKRLVCTNFAHKICKGGCVHKNALKSAGRFCTKNAQHANVPQFCKNVLQNMQNTANCCTQLLHNTMVASLHRKDCTSFCNT